MTQPTPQIPTPDLAPTTKATNTLGLVALILTIIGLLLTISLIGIFFGVPLLVVGLLLGLIAVFKTPRRNALIGIIIAVISLGTLTYATYWVADQLRLPIRNFSNRMASEIETNTEFRMVTNQPEFGDFFWQHMQTKRAQINWKSFAEEYSSGSFTSFFQYYVELLFAEMQNEMLNIVDMWVQQYGIPVPNEELFFEREIGDTTVFTVENVTEESVEKSVIQDIETLLQSLEE
ncbi:MAG: hypothetical protein LBD75_02780 [Candidatus Peribacteria bacterium]|nr:hypothetical protein [Candidatus Peribacteria bacterium]